MDALLHWITAHLPCRFIDGDNGESYLERYYLFGVGGWHCYLHRFVASDPDRGLHDHPWGRAVSLVLAGGYDEIRLKDRQKGETEVRRLRPGGINRLRGEDFHRVVLREDRPAWTLFFHGPRVKGWGFLRGGEFLVCAADASEFRHRDWWLSAPTGGRMRAARAAQLPQAATRSRASETSGWGNRRRQKPGPMSYTRRTAFCGKRGACIAAENPSVTGTQDQNARR